MRTIRNEEGVEEQIAKLGIGFARYDDLMLVVHETLCKYPEMFPVLPGTKLSWCRTNEFVGMTFSGIPALSLYFYYDADHVYVLAVERYLGDDAY